MSESVHLVARSAFQTGLFKIRYRTTTANWDTLTDLDGAVLNGQFSPALCFVADGLRVLTNSPGSPVDVLRCEWYLDGELWRADDLFSPFTMVAYSLGMIDPTDTVDFPSPGSYTITCTVVYLDFGGSLESETVTATFQTTGASGGGASIAAAVVSAVGSVPAQDVSGDGSVTLAPTVITATGTVGTAAVDTGESVRPNATNTGPTGTLTKSFGGVNITQAWLDANNAGSLVLEDVEFSGQVTVSVNNLTIRNFKITGGNYGVYNNVFTGSPSTGLVLEDGELTEQASASLVVSNCTARRLHAHHLGIDAFKPFSNVTIEDCYVHHVGYDTGGHSDAVQMVSGGNVTVTGCFFDMPNPLTDTFNGQQVTWNHSQVFIIQTNNGGISGVTIDGNWLNGALYTVNVKDKNKGHGYPQNIAVTNNRFGRDYQFGLFNIDGGGYTITGNVWDDTGASI